MARWWAQLPNSKLGAGTWCPQTSQQFKGQSAKLTMNEHEEIADEVDTASAVGDRSRLSEIIAKIDKLLESEFRDDLLLNYFRANAFAGKRKSHPNFETRQFEWQQPELTQEIISLRRAAHNPEFKKLPVLRRCQILTNLGGALDTVGRPIDALAAWDQALTILPNFAMAQANRANGLAFYSGAFYDPGHRCVFLGQANRGFDAALAKDAEWDSYYPEGLRKQLQSRQGSVRKYLAANCDLSGFDPEGFSLGETDSERAFNQWRLANRLFLNPLNDVGADTVAARDVFHLPGHSYGLDDPIVFPRYFDLLKQEYVAACTLLYEGLEFDRTYPADTTLLTFEHGDYGVNCVQTEKQKAAFRMAYSLLDKCAIFINGYFKLGQNSKSLATSFRNIWYVGRGEKRKLNPKLPKQNWRLRGLFSLSMDLFEDGFRNVASPMAHQANDIRNAAEHRFLSVHELVAHTDQIGDCLPLSVQNFEQHALHMLKLARSAIMGVSLAVYHQENHLMENNGDLMVPMPAVAKHRTRR